MGGGNVFKVSKDTWSLTTPHLLYCACVYALGNIFFGFDTANFGSVQVLPSFLREFGDLNAQGQYYMSPSRKSVMSSSTMIIAPLLEKYGHKTSMFVTCAIQLVGVIIQCIAKEWILFTSGRVIVYLAVGAVENIVPIYQAETVPAPLRGFFTGSIQLLLVLGALWANGMSRAFATETKTVGWLVPTAVQAIPCVLIIILLPFTSGSPRWYLSKGRKVDAVRALQRLRPARLTTEGGGELEPDAIEQDIQEKRNADKGNWLDLFRGTNLRRTTICTVLFIFQQWTGTQFINTYGPTFYKQQGLGAMTFTYTVINSAVSVVVCLIGMVLMDVSGRRPILIYGCLAQALFVYLVAGLGGSGAKDLTTAHAMVACVILFSAAVHVSLGPCAYAIGSEIGTAALREKTMAFGTAINVVAAWVVVFTSPYLLSEPYAALGPRVGWIWGSFALAATIYTIFFVPELKNRSLEEIDELFESREWAWKFNEKLTHGAAHLVTEAQTGAATEGIQLVSHKTEEIRVADVDKSA